jgi:RNA polymerase sigma-70 factor, ECF subfamily
MVATEVKIERFAGQLASHCSVVPKTLVAVATPQNYRGERKGKRVLCQHFLSTRERVKTQEGSTKKEKNPRSINGIRHAIHDGEGVLPMAATALLLNPEPTPIGRYQGKSLELAHLVAHHSARFRRIALAHLGNVADAEDAVQDALLSALTHVDQFRGQAQMSTWLTSIVINSARMKLRRRSRQVQFVLDETLRDQQISLADLVSDTRPGPEQVYRNREMAGTLARATSGLSPILRMTFQLRDVDGLSISETAHRMGVPSGTVKARLARARARLRKAINQRSAGSGHRIR